MNFDKSSQIFYGGSWHEVSAKASFAVGMKSVLKLRLRFLTRLPGKSVSGLQMHHWMM